MFVAALQIPGVERLCPPAPITSVERTACAVASWSQGAQLALLVGGVLLVTGLVLAGRWAYLRLWGPRRPRYDNQPTIPIVFPTGEGGLEAAGDGANPSFDRDEWQQSDAESGDREAERVDGGPRMSSRGSGAADSERAVKLVDPRHERAEGGRESAPRRMGPRTERYAGREARPERSNQLRDTDTAAGQGEQTLQLLPGRMEVVSGGQRGRQIRFVRTVENKYTFGRQPGSGSDHIQLDNPTVSRQHAAMRYVDGGWRIRNLSDTNPLLINGQLVDRGEHVLHDGDRVEMGEVVFVFRGS